MKEWHDIYWADPEEEGNPFCEYEHIDEIGYYVDMHEEVFLDRELKHHVNEADFGYLTISDAYIEACEEEAVFLPNMTAVVNTYDDCTNVFEEPIKLNAYGRWFALKWKSDASVGYDLCNGRCKGLARGMSEQDMWEHVKKYGSK